MAPENMADNWPYVRGEGDYFPATLPDGTPWPKISVVTPSFNQGKYIEQTILSVANQGYPHVEHIIIDGASSDQTPQVLERHRSKLAYVVSEPDGGQSHAINKGMARATGSILTWLNSDDMLAPGALASMAIAFWSSGADLVAGVCRLYSNGQLVGQHLTSCAIGPLPLNDLLDLDGGWNAGQFFYQPEVMFTRELWAKAGGYVDETLYYSMDYELWVRFAEAGARIHVIGRPVAWFRLHPEQKTHVQAKFMTELSEYRQAYCQRTGRTYRSRGTPNGESRLRVLLLNDHGFQFGAGLAHERIGETLTLAGHHVLPVALVDHPVPPHIETTYTYAQLADLVERFQPHLAILGNLHSAKADASLIGALTQHCPTLAITHDFWLITGRCAYPAGCEKYLSGCDKTCPTPDEYPQLAPTKIAEAWHTKQQVRNMPDLALLTNSQWSAAVIRKSLPTTQNSTPLETFRLSFPLDTFRPLDRTTCRHVLGLPEDRFLVLMTSEFADPRKGCRYVIDALRELALPDLTLVTTSWSQPDPDQIANLPFIHLGYVHDPARLALAYAAADLTVGASLEETFGQIFVESAACGTPAVGFAATGVAEAIRDGVTGRLAPNVTASDLATTIFDLYSNHQLRRDMSFWGRRYVENEWSPYASYYHLFQAFDRLQLLDRLKLPHKISFLPSPPALPKPQLLSEVQLPKPTLLQLGHTAITQVLTAKHGRRLAEAWKVSGLGIRFLVNRFASLWKSE